MARAGYTRQNVRLGPTNMATIGSSDVSICTPDSTGKVFTAKHIHIANNAAATHYACVSIGPNSTAANRIIDQVAIAANSEYDRFCNHIVGNSDTGGLCVAADLTGTLTITVYGVLETISS